MKYSLLWDITQCRLTVTCWHFGKTGWFIFKGQAVQVWSLKVECIECPETSVNNYQSTPRNMPEERISNLQRSGKLKSRIITVRICICCTSTMGGWWASVRYCKRVTVLNGIDILTAKQKLFLKMYFTLQAVLQTRINNEDKSSVGYLSILHSEIQISRKTRLFETSV